MAITFVNGNPRVNLDSLAPLSGAAAMTIAGWIRLSDLGADATIAIRGTSFSNAAPWIVWRDDVASISGRVNTLTSLVNTNVGTLRVEGTSNLLNDTSDWHHVAMVFEAGSTQGLRQYVGGAKDTNFQSTIGHSQLVTNTSAVTLGIDLLAAQFLGEMAEVSLWDVAISDSEIAQLAAGFSPLALARTGRWPVVYQDMIRGLNHPGIGPTATSNGTLTASPHPRILPALAAMRQPSGNQSLVAGPHRAQYASIGVVGSEAAQTFIPGVQQGTAHPFGEVHP